MHFLTIVQNVDIYDRIGDAASVTASAETDIKVFSWLEQEVICNNNAQWDTGSGTAECDCHRLRCWQCCKVLWSWRGTEVVWHSWLKVSGSYVLEFVVAVLSSMQQITITAKGGSLDLTDCQRSKAQSFNQDVFQERWNLKRHLVFCHLYYSKSHSHLGLVWVWDQSTVYKGSF